MKPNYKNWVPRGLVVAMFVVAFIAFILGIFVLVLALPLGFWRWVLGMLLIAIGIVSLMFGFWCVMARSAFSYDGDRQLSKQIVDGIVDEITPPDGARILDVGCGSGALTIALAKRNPTAHVVGIDRWGREYDSFSKSLCEQNALAEGVQNVSFVSGDAKKLDYPDESFDVVVSNYVYHNIAGANKQNLLKETLRVLKKGGIFAIHDIMSRRRFGDMDAFEKELLDRGYASINRLDTTNGKFMTQKEARRLFLSGSTLLIGKK